MKIYIAGKIAGDRRYRAKFREAAKALEAAGHVVLNPATLPDGLADGDYMRIALAMLEASDLAVFLPDYQESRGAMVEWAWCQRTGKECALYLDCLLYTSRFSPDFLRPLPHGGLPQGMPARSGAEQPGVVAVTFAGLFRSASCGHTLGQSSMGQLSQKIR